MGPKAWRQRQERGEARAPLANPIRPRPISASPEAHCLASPEACYSAASRSRASVQARLPPAPERIAVGPLAAVAVHLQLVALGVVDVALPGDLRLLEIGLAPHRAQPLDERQKLGLIVHLPGEVVQARGLRQRLAAGVARLAQHEAVVHAARGPAGDRLAVGEEGVVALVVARALVDRQAEGVAVERRHPVEVGDVEAEVSEAGRHARRRSGGEAPRTGSLPYCSGRRNTPRVTRARPSW